MFAEEFPRRPMRSLIAIERDLMRQLALALERTAEERFGRRDITLGAEQEINSLSLLVNGAIDVSAAVFKCRAAPCVTPQTGHCARLARSACALSLRLCGPAQPDVALGPKLLTSPLPIEQRRRGEILMINFRNVVVVSLFATVLGIKLAWAVVAENFWQQLVRLSRLPLSKSIAARARTLSNFSPNTQDNHS